MPSSRQFFFISGGGLQVKEKIKKAADPSQLRAMMEQQAEDSGLFCGCGNEFKDDAKFCR